MYVDLVNKSKDSGHFVPLGISHHGPGGTKTSRGSGASLFLWEVPEPSCREAWDMFPGKTTPRTPQDSSLRSLGLSQAMRGRCVAVLEGWCVPLASASPCVVPVDKKLGLGSDQG